MSRHGYRGDGAYGQFCVVLPELDVVVATTAATEDMQAILDAAWRHLLPAMHSRPLTGVAAAAADQDLRVRLAQLRLPAVAGVRPAPADERAWLGYAGEVAGTGPLQRVEVTRDHDGWEVTLVDPVAQYRVRLGTSDWAVSGPAAPDGSAVPIATHGGWTAEGALRFDVTFLETPHRLHVTCADAPEPSATQQWLTAPLHARYLGDLRSPRVNPVEG